MIILVSGATKTVRRFSTNKHLGSLITPQAGNRPPDNMEWAADNAAYSNWDRKKFVRMLATISKHNNKPIFVASPDVVGDAIKTDILFRTWMPIIKNHNLPVALVLQNGQEFIGLNWDNVDAVFIGGDDDFKLGKYVRYAVGKAKSKGKWVHMGRVNSIKRILYARSIGCDSIDGTSFSMFPDTYIPKYLRLLEKEQISMF